MFFKIEYNCLTCLGKFYETDQEETRRKNLFADSLKKIEAHKKLYDQGLKTYTLGLTEFADWVSQLNSVCTLLLQYNHFNRTLQVEKLYLYSIHPFNLQGLT